MSPKQWTARYSLLAGVAGGALLLAACGGAGNASPTTTNVATAPAVTSPTRAITRVATPAAPTGIPSSVPTATAAPTAPASAPATTPAPAAGQQKYVVKYGDTLSSIAAQYGVTVQQIIDANSLQNPDLLLPGQELIIPAQ